MRPKRFLLALILAAALTPGNIWYEPQPQRTLMRLAQIDPLGVGRAQSGPFELVGAWHMTGDPKRFGGFSALVALDGLRFLAGSDAGMKLVFERPDRSDLPAVLSFVTRNDPYAKVAKDLESLAVDPEVGTVWAGYEYRSAIVRLKPNLKPGKEVRPAAMEDWGENSGPEALVRLADGRFLVIEEGEREWGGEFHNALLFGGDPVEGADAEELSVRLPGGYRPVDATATDDGRALVLLRRVGWALPPVFESAIAEIDVDRRTGGDTLDLRMLAEFGADLPQDNYEGIAMTRDEDGTHVWLISDDNFMQFQRTLLLKLRWQPREKARE